MKFILVWLVVLKFATGSSRVSVQLPYNSPAGVTYVEGRASSDLVAGPSQRVITENASVRSIDSENRSGRYEITEEYLPHNHNGQSTPVPSFLGKAARILQASSYASFPSSYPQPQPQPRPQPQPHPQPHPHPHPYPHPHPPHIESDPSYRVIQRPTTVTMIQEQPIYSQQVDASADAAIAPDENASPAPVYRAPSSPVPKPTFSSGSPGSPGSYPSAGPGSGYPSNPAPRFPNPGYSPGPGPQYPTTFKPGTSPPGSYIPRTPVTPSFKSKPSGIPPIYYIGGVTVTGIPYQPIFPIATPTLYPQPEIVTVQQPGYVTLQSPTVSFGSHPVPAYGHSLPVTRADGHSSEQVVTKTIDVAQPAIKTSRYEVRRPAIQKQFYDIEERIIVRPAGTVVLELDHPISRTAKGETIQDVQGHYGNTGDEQQHGQLNLEIGTPSQHGIISQPTHQQESSSSSYGELQSTTTTAAPSTQESLIGTTTTNPQDDDTIVVEARTNANQDSTQFGRINESSNMPATKNLVRYQVGEPTHNTACTIACQQRAALHQELLNRQKMVYYQQPQTAQYYQRSEKQEERLGQLRQETSSPASVQIRQQYKVLRNQEDQPQGERFGQLRQDSSTTQVRQQYNFLRNQEDQSQRQQFGQLRQESSTPIAPQIRQQFNLLRAREEEQPQQRLGQLRQESSSQFRQQYDFQPQEDEQPRLEQQRVEKPGIAQFRQQYNIFRSEQQAFPPQRQQYRARQQLFASQQQDDEEQARVVEVKQEDLPNLGRSAAQKTIMPFMISVGESDERYQPYGEASYKPLSRTSMKSAYTQESSQQQEQPLQQFRLLEGEQTIQQRQQFEAQPREFQQQNQPQILQQQQRRQEQNEANASILPSATPQLLRNSQVSSQFAANAALVEQESTENQRKYINLLLGQGGVSEVSGALHAEGSSSGYLRSRVISATPAPYNAQPVDDRVKTRRIVVSQPLETVQEVEVQEPVTKFQRLSIKQPVLTKGATSAPVPAFSRSMSPFVRPLNLGSQKVE